MYVEENRITTDTEAPQKIYGLLFYHEWVLL